jgi:hypothetical protein
MLCDGFNFRGLFSGGRYSSHYEYGNFRITKGRKAMKLEQAAEYIQDSLDGCGDSLDEESIAAYEMGIKALKEQAKGEKGCEYCNGDSLDNFVLTNFCGKPHVAFRGGNTPVDESEKPKFCPHCGRPLNKEKSNESH